MIRTNGKHAAYQTEFSNDSFTSTADAPVNKGGGGEGFGPHELLEAALATCMNMWIRMRASERGCSVDNVRTTVQLDRTHATKAVFKFGIEISGNLSSAERESLIAEAAQCPVRTTLTKDLDFRPF